MSATLSPSSWSSRARWAVPVIAVVGVVGAFAGPALLAGADANLPPLSVEQLVAKVAAAEPGPMSGTVVYTAHLGLPEMPLTKLAGASPINLLSGSSTLRVWTDGQARSRVSLLGQTSEYSVVHDNAQAWTYSSTDNAVTHWTLDPADAASLAALGKQADAGTLPGVADLPTPTAAASEALTLAQESSTITLDAETTVAGRGAYQLVVTPKTTETLISRIVVAVDAKTFTPLRVQVWSTQDTTAPALELGFTDVTFATPADSVLAFSAPPGATVTEKVVNLPDKALTAEALAQADKATPEPTETAAAVPDGVTVHGSGWGTVLEVSGMNATGMLADPAKAAAGLGAASADASAGAGLAGDFLSTGSGDSSAMSGLDVGSLYQQLTTPVAGGRLLSSALVSVLLMDDGRVLVGAVPASTLQALAG